MHCKQLVFTDMDGTLLDHETYSHKPAAALLNALKKKGVPVIPVTSKTRAELLPIRQTIGNADPFIVENGAAIVIPDGYFKAMPEGYQLLDGFWYCSFARPRSYWLELLNGLKAEFGSEFTHFHALGEEGIVELTGLSHEEALRANQRQYSEPVAWLGSEERRQVFYQRLAQSGIEVVKGGRFIHLSDRCNKGSAMRQLAALYSLELAQPVEVIAAGDGENDIPMLELADQAVIVRSSFNPLPKVEGETNIHITRLCGPAGWAETIARLTGVTESSELQENHYG